MKVLISKKIMVIFSLVIMPLCAMQRVDSWEMVYDDEVFVPHKGPVNSQIPYVRLQDAKPFSLQGVLHDNHFNDGKEELYHPIKDLEYEKLEQKKLEVLQSKNDQTEQKHKPLLIMPVVSMQELKKMEVVGQHELLIKNDTQVQPQKPIELIVVSRELRQRKSRTVENDDLKEISIPIENLQPVMQNISLQEDKTFEDHIADGLLDLSARITAFFYSCSGERY